MQLRFIRGVVPLVFCCVFGASMGTLNAQDPHESESAANVHYQTAVRLFGEGRYREALGEFNEAIAIRDEPVFHCNRALVLLKLSETEEAVHSLERCRDGFEGDEREFASIDAQLQGVSTFQYVLRSSAITVAQDIASGPIVGPTPRRSQSGWDLADFGYLTAGVGGALLASALTLDLTSATLRDEFEAESRGGIGTSSRRHEDLRGQLKTRQTAFLVLGISGAVVTLTGISMIIAYYVSDDESDSGVSVVPQINSEGSAGIGISGTW